MLPFKEFGRRVVLKLQEVIICLDDKKIEEAKSKLEQLIKYFS
jgi:hypothetical protein